MEAVFGAHNWPGMKVGQFARAAPGRCFASSNEFKITIRGKGAHAAMPHNGIDPVPVACQMVQAFQTIITRNKQPIDAGVISVTMIHAGEATNVVPDSCEIAGHGAHLHARGARPDRAAHEEDRRAHLRGLRRRVRVRVPAQLPADHQPRRPRPSSRAGDGRARRRRERAGVRADHGRRGLQLLPAAGQARLLLPASATATAATATAATACGPCMLHNPSYDFNDDLIPLGATCWVRLAEAVAQAPARRGGGRMIGVGEAFSPSYAAGARRSSCGAARRAGLAVQAHAASAARAATARRWRWTWRATAPPMPSALLIVSSACHGVEGFCGSGVQVVAAARCRRGASRRARSRRRGALRARAQPATASRGGGA